MLGLLCNHFIQTVYLVTPSASLSPLSPSSPMSPSSPLSSSSSLSPSSSSSPSSSPSYISINRNFLLCTKPNPLFVVLEVDFLAVFVSSSRRAFVQSGPRLSTNTPTFSAPNECAASFPFCPCLANLACLASLARPPYGNKSSQSLCVHPLNFYY